jgi:hypothetical protein
LEKPRFLADSFGWAAFDSSHRFASKTATGGTLDRIPSEFSCMHENAGKGCFPNDKSQNG